MTTITIERALLEQALDAFQSIADDEENPMDTREAMNNLRAALAAPATAPKHRTVSDDLIACLRGGRQCDADGVEVIMSRQACREAADILESWAIDQAPATAPEQCWCDEHGIGEPGVSCGDCPTRDYKTTAPEQPAWQDAPTEVKQIAEALRHMGLTLVRTGTDYKVLKLGEITAQEEKQ